MPTTVGGLAARRCWADESTPELASVCVVEDPRRAELEEARPICTPSMRMRSALGSPSSCSKRSSLMELMGISNRALGSWPGAESFHERATYGGYVQLTVTPAASSKDNLLKIDSLVSSCASSSSFASVAALPVATWIVDCRKLTDRRKLVVFKSDLGSVVPTVKKWHRLGCRETLAL
eukprot:7177712-Prymnesium_polylepis.1